ncbi:MAG: radical SAM protein [Dehalococcoidales bacterium]|nr:radical SAM protein [Dehalococcoidales bacterium]
MLTGLHFLLTYRCSSECDHCFLHCSPRSQGTFTLGQIKSVLEEAKKIGTITQIYFEGGEPFLYYPLMLEGIRLARNAGFDIGIVTNTYFATEDEDIELWLKPLKELGISDLSLSNDRFHYENPDDNSAIRTHRIAGQLGLPVGEISIEEPSVSENEYGEKGEPIIGGGTMLRGRAADKLVAGLPVQNWEGLTACEHEELVHPSRVHLDSYGNVQICQGISMGNMWKTPLSEIAASYDAASHPICGPLVRGGPAQLARKYNIEHDEEYVDACHFCYSLRKSMLDRFPEYLAPPQVYGFE